MGTLQRDSSQLTGADRAIWFHHRRKDWQVVAVQLKGIEMRDEVSRMYS